VLARLQSHRLVELSSTGAISWWEAANQCLTI
jgi:hypothetical protein